MTIMRKTTAKTIAFAAGLCIVLYIGHHLMRSLLNVGSLQNDIHLESAEELAADNSPAKPLLTLFTTFKEVGMIPHHQLSFDVVVSNWPSFKPIVRPVMFLSHTNSSMARKASESGWDVIPMTRVNEAGTPFLRDMYQVVFERYDSWLYGYANGDLIFDDGLTKTLRVVVDNLTPLGNNVLMTGIRTNVDVDVINREVFVDEFQKNRLKELAERRGKLFRQNAVDYFFMTKYGCSLNWTSLVDVVIGRPGYGTYLVAMAAKQGVNVIDTTGTVLAVHPSEKGVLSHGSLNPDVEYNRNLIGSKFQHSVGYPENLKLFTTLNDDGTMQLKKRS